MLVNGINENKTPDELQLFMFKLRHKILLFVFSRGPTVSHILN